MWRRHSLRGRGAFRRVMREGRRQTWGDLTMYLHARPGPTRVGLIVVQAPRSAVTRNRVRRRLRAVARQAFPAVGWEVVLKASAAAATTDFQEMVRNVKRGLSRAGARD